MPSEAFSCRACGQCCHGEGGIGVSPEEIAGLAEFLGLDPKAFLARYAVFRHGRPEIGVTGPGKACVFLQDGRCAVHPVKPRICRDWPFIPAALEEEAAFWGLRGDCPGFDPAADWNRFREQYLSRAKVG